MEDYFDAQAELYSYGIEADNNRKLTDFIRNIKERAKKESFLHKKIVSVKRIRV